MTTAIEQLRERFKASAHPFPDLAVTFATGGDEARAQQVLEDLDAPPASPYWVGTDSRPRACPPRGFGQR